MEFIDISKWNGVFDWSKAVAKGIEGAYLKATGTGNGGSYEDYRFKENSASCPLKYKGTYHYFDYRGYSGADQCKYFLDITGNFGNMRGVLDIEDNSANSWIAISKNYGVVMRESFAWVTEYLKETGHLPVLYLNLGLTLEKQFTTSGYKYLFRNFLECPLWIANYNKVTNPLRSLDGKLSAWPYYAMWQYTRGGDGLAFGNSPGNAAIDLNTVKDLSLLLKPGVTIEDEPVSTPVEIPLTIEQRLGRIEKLLNIA